MTINSETRVAGPFEGNDSTVIFPFSFKVFDSDELYVVRTTDGVETALTWEVDYAVTLNPDQNASPGGEITLADALATGSTLTLTSDLEALQPLDLTNQGGFYPRVINNAFDRVTILIQQLKSVVSRTLKFPLSDGPVGDLPGRDARAGRVLAFDPDTAEPVAGPTIYEVETVAATNEAIAIVASNIDDVVIVADNIDDVTNFADVYYGPSATDPTTRRDGSPLQVGDLYFNTEVDRMQVYTGTEWVETISGTISVQNFSGDGVTTEFVLDFAPGDEVVTQVFVGGIYQQKNTYELGGVDGDTLIFSEAPPTGTDNIEVVINSATSIGLTDASSVAYEGGTVETALDSRPEVIENVAAIASFTPVVGRTYQLKEYNAGTGKGGGPMVGKEGAITADNVTTFAATSGFYLERINTLIMPEHAGCVIDEITDDTEAFERFIDAGGSFAGAGIFRFTEKITKSFPNQTHLSLLGLGRDKTQFLFDCEDGGFDFTFDNDVRQDGTTCTLKDFSILTNRLPAVAGTALSITGGHAEGMTHPGLIIENVLYRGDVPSNGWGRGDILFNATKSQHVFVEFIGKEGDYTGEPFKVQGSALPTDHQYDRCYANWFNSFGEVGDLVEGVFFDRCVGVAGIYGVNRAGVNDTRALISIKSCHFNVATSAVKTSCGVPQMIIDGNWFYEWEINTGAFKAIDLVNCIYGKIINNNINTFGLARTKNGVHLTGCGGITIGKNTFVGLVGTPITHGVYLNGGANNKIKVTQDNDYDFVTNKITGTATASRLRLPEKDISGSATASANGSLTINIAHGLGFTPDLSLARINYGRVTSGVMDVRGFVIIGADSSVVQVKAEVFNYAAPGDVICYLTIEG